MIRHGTELYGSNRSFLSIVNYVKKNISDINKVILPCLGELAERMKQVGVVPHYHDLGILRKRMLKSIFLFLLT
jgi:hypothetical protein